MRDLGNSELPRGLGAVRSTTLPLQDDLAVIDRDQPASYKISCIVSAVGLNGCKMRPRSWAEWFASGVATHRSVGGKAAEKEHTYFDFLRPSSTSPSTETTCSTEMTAPSDPSTCMVISSRSNHSLAHGVTVLFFQCQFAVLYAMGVTDMLKVETNQRGML